MQRRLENQEKTDAMLLACGKKNELKAQEETLQRVRREAHRGDVQNISEILRNQSLANLPKSNLQCDKEEKSSRTHGAVIGEEENAWMSLGTSAGTSQTTEAPVGTVKKKRAYVRKNLKNEMQGVNGPDKNKE
jgi:hypothetical protein